MTPPTYFVHLSDELGGTLIIPARTRAAMTALEVMEILEKRGYEPQWMQALPTAQCYDPDEPTNTGGFH